MSNTAPNLSIVVPCYNEDEVILDSYNKLSSILNNLITLNKISTKSSIYFIDDGSSDTTWSIIESLCKKSKNVTGLKLSRNCGHQNALLAGLFTTTSDITISIDVDLQDDINVIEKMIDEYSLKASQIVYGVRNDRKSDTFFKRNTARLFYKAMRLMGVSTIENHADFRLMSRQALDALRKFKETNLYLRGIIPLIGLKSSMIYYQRAPRLAGESKYPLSKMISLAITGITSFSIAPLRFISILGFIVFILSSILGIWSLIVTIAGISSVPGWASTVLPIYFIGSVQLLSLGVIGEYIGKIYNELKARPKYIIDKEINQDSPPS